MLRSSFVAILLVLAGGCSVVSIDLTPRIRPLEEQTVEGRGDNKILLMDFSGLLTDEVGSGSLTLGTRAAARSPPRPCSRGTGEGLARPQGPGSRHQDQQSRVGR